MTVDFDEVCAWSNLLDASHRATRGRRGSPAVARFDYDLERELLDLRSSLREGSYRPGRHHSFFVHDPKQRLISAAPVRDRVVHHALCNVLEPVLERSFVDDSFANRIGKGTHRGLDHCQNLARRHRWVLSCDIRQYFASVDHAILTRTLFRYVRDERTRWLIRLIIAGGAGAIAETWDPVWFPGDDLLSVCRPRGLPIGNLTSQLWANVYLNGFDHFVKRELRCPGYVRYVDDFVLFDDDRGTLWGWKAAIERRLARLRLTIHPGAHPRPVTEGIPFLGFVVRPNQRRLKGRKVTHFARRLRTLVAAVERGEATTRDLEATVRSWIAHASHGDTRALQKSLLGRVGLDPDDFDGTERDRGTGAGGARPDHH